MSPGIPGWSGGCTGTAAGRTGQAAQSPAGSASPARKVIEGIDEVKYISSIIIRLVQKFAISTLNILKKKGVERFFLYFSMIRTFMGPCQTTKITNSYFAMYIVHATVESKC